MNIEENQIEKADPLLQEALKSANGDEILRTIMHLESNDSELNHLEQELDPKQFSDRVAYRQELINTRQKEISHQLGNLMQELRSRSLKIFGGAISPIVVVEGTAREILNSLNLPGVRHASLDREISLIKPSRRQ